MTIVSFAGAGVFMSSTKPTGGSKPGRAETRFCHRLNIIGDKSHNRTQFCVRFFAFPVEFTTAMQSDPAPFRVCESALTWIAVLVYPESMKRTRKLAGPVGTAAMVAMAAVSSLAYAEENLSSGNSLPIGNSKADTHNAIPWQDSEGGPRGERPSSPKIPSRMIPGSPTQMLGDNPESPGDQAGKSDEPPEEQSGDKLGEQTANPSEPKPGEPVNGPNEQADKSGDQTGKPHLKAHSDDVVDDEKLLGSLMDRLAKSDDAESAKVLEDAIRKVWLRSGSATIDLLMSEASEATSSKKYETAIKLLDAVVDLAPDYAEGWNKRATVFYLENDYARSAQDIKKALELEPRHFGALSGLGMIMRELGDDGGALSAFREALKYHPHLSGAREAVGVLIDIVEGREI